MLINNNNQSNKWQQLNPFMHLNMVKTQTKNQNVKEGGFLGLLTINICISKSVSALQRTVSLGDIRDLKNATVAKIFFNFWISNVLKLEVDRLEKR